MNGFVRIDDGLTVDQVATALRTSRAHVTRLERDALIKMRIGLAIVELVGRARAEELLVALRGRPLSAWRGVLADARNVAMREAHRAAR